MMMYLKSGVMIASRLPCCLKIRGALIAVCAPV
jgi:hypothetical protein